MIPWRNRRRKLRDQKWEKKDGKYQPVLLEEHVLREIVERLWLQAKIKVWRINCAVGGKVRPNEPGISDLIGFIPKHGLGVNTEGMVNPVFGTALFIEVKRPGAVRRPAQERFIAEAKAGGCCAFFAESWDDVVRELALFGINLKGV